MTMQVPSVHNHSPIQSHTPHSHTPSLPPQAPIEDTPHDHLLLVSPIAEDKDALPQPTTPTEKEAVCCVEEIGTQMGVITTADQNLRTQDPTCHTQGEREGTLHDQRERIQETKTNINEYERRIQHWVEEGKISQGMGQFLLQNLDAYKDALEGLAHNLLDVLDKWAKEGWVSDEFAEDFYVDMANMGYLPELDISFLDLTDENRMLHEQSQWTPLVPSKEEEQQEVTRTQKNPEEKITVAQLEEIFRKEKLERASEEKRQEEAQEQVEFAEEIDNKQDEEIQEQLLDSFTLGVRAGAEGAL